MTWMYDPNGAEAPPVVVAPASTARRWRIGGRVQGVGFRPFVYRLACRYRIAGWVRNTGGEVEVHGEGTADRLDVFGEALLAQAPPAASARLLDVRRARAELVDEFRILTSTAGENARIHVPPDLNACEDCLAELAIPVRGAMAIPSSTAPVRPSLHADPGNALRPGEYGAGRLRTMPRMPGRIHTDPLDRALSRRALGLRCVRSDADLAGPPIRHRRQ